MKITPFAKVYRRISKRTTQNPLAVYGSSEKSKGFSDTKRKIRYFGRNSVDVSLAVKQRAYDKIMKKHKEKDLPGPSPNFPCSPPANTSDKVSMNQIVMSSDTAGRNSIDVSLAGKQRAYDKIMKKYKEKDLPSSSPNLPCSPPANASNEVSMNQIVMSSNTAAEEVPEALPCPAILVPRLQARRKSRKRKIESDDELIEEVTAPKRIHVRGRMRRGQKNCNKSISERGMLDSGKFQDYFLHLWNGFSDEIVKSVAYFEPLWFTQYATKARSHKALDWMKSKGVLSKKYVLVPIVMWSHWSLLIFCNLGESLLSKTNAPCMLLLDSLHAVGPNRLEPLIRRLLLELYNTEEKQVSKQEITKIPFLIPKVPQQVKGDECGYYVLQFITLFLKSAPETFSTSQGCPNFMNKDWFTVEDIQSFYTKLDSFDIISSKPDNSTSSDSSDCVQLIGCSFDDVSSRVK